MEKKEILEFKYNADIVVFNELLQCFDMLADIVKKFDGKVFNKRICTALKKELDNVFGVDKCFVNIDVPYYGAKQQIKIAAYGHRCADGSLNGYPYYVDLCDESVTPVLDSEGRIVAEGTLVEIEGIKTHITSHIQNRLDVLENYDKYLTMENNLKSACKEYCDNINYLVKMSGVYRFA